MGATTLNNNVTRACPKCGRVKKVGDFYRSKNLEKYPDDGLFNMCKDCMTMMVDNWNPDTYLWILQEADVPYIPNEWNGLMLKYAQDPAKVKGTTIIGRYLSKMKLKQWSKYRWKDTEFLQQMQEKEITETMERQGYEAAEIAEVLDKGRMSIPKKIDIPEYSPEEYMAATGLVKGVPPKGAPPEVVSPTYLQDQLKEEQDSFEGLTDEDKVYLRMKWGASYHPEEWVHLESFYNEMMNSFDIQSAAQIDTLKFICKTSLKMHHAIDADDVEAYQKYSKVYDAQMKAGKFTAAQNKEANGEFVDSVGELFALCEKDGYVERFYIEQPNDKVDQTIEDMKRYTQSLVDGETNLSNMIESALRQNAREDDEAKENAETEIVDEEDLTIEDIEKERMESFNEFADFQEEEYAADLKTQDGGV